MSNYFAGQSVPAHKDTIMVHCLDTPKRWRDGESVRDIVKEVRRWHVDERKWSDIAYAAIINGRGELGLGRDLDGDGNVLEETGAGARGHNKRVIHLALVGGKGSTANDLFSDHYTGAQDRTLRDAIEEIEAIAGRKMKVIGHNDVAAKACPGFKVDRWYKNKPPRTIAASKTMQGGVASGLGTLGQIVTEQAKTIEQVKDLAPTLNWLFVGLTVAGVALVLYSRWDDWNRGRK